MNNVKIFTIMIASCILSVTSSLGDGAELLPSLRAQLSRVVNAYGYTQLRPLLILNDWNGMNVWTNNDFRGLSRSVTNHWDEVLSMLPEISTNQSERLIVMAAGVVQGEQRFLSCVESVANAALSNKVNAIELRFYKSQCSFADPSAVSSLVRRYQEPAISNLIMKMSSAGAYPQGVGRIFSGEEKELYLDAVHDGLR